MAKKKAAKKAAKKVAKKAAKKTKKAAKKPAKKSPKKVAKKPSKKAAKKPAKKVARKKKMSAKRELIDTGTDLRYVRRDDDGTFSESVDVGRSIAADMRQEAEAVAEPGMGDRGD